jgi:hypothetical protein
MISMKHYLVAEYFITAPTTMTPELFYSKTKQDQADLIWIALFEDRMPLSEATRGVGTLSLLVATMKEMCEILPSTNVSNLIDAESNHPCRFRAF